MVEPGMTVSLSAPFVMVTDDVPLYMLNPTP